MKMLLFLLATCMNTLVYSLAAMVPMDKTLAIRDHRSTSLLRRSPTKEFSGRSRSPTRQDQNTPNPSSSEQQESQSNPGTTASVPRPQKPWDNPHGTRDGAPFKWHARVGGSGYQGYIDNYTRSRSNSPSNKGQTPGQANSPKFSNIHNPYLNPRPG